MNFRQNNRQSKAHYWLFLLILPLLAAACQILENPNITLATQHVSGVSDQATAWHNVVQEAADLPVNTSCYGNAPCTTTQLDVNLTYAMLVMADTYSYSVSELAGGSHSPNSRHYVGVAMDVNVINGQHVSSSNPHVQGFMQMCINLGATEVLGPGSAGHSTHIHCAWPRPARSSESSTVEQQKEAAAIVADLTSGELNSKESLALINNLEPAIKTIVLADETLQNYAAQQLVNSDPSSPKNSQ